MADYVKRIRTTTGDKQIDYTALANLPTLLSIDSTFTDEKKAAGAKATRDLINSTLPLSKYQSGNIISNKNTLNDKDISISVKSKNLIVYPYINTTVTSNSGTFTAGSDGGITGSGTPTGICEINLAALSNVSKNILTLSATGTFQNMCVALIIQDSTDTQLDYILTTDSVIIDLNKYPTVNKVLISIKRVENNIEMSGTLYPKLEVGAVVTSYSKYVSDNTNVTVSVCGKNLINVDYDCSFSVQYNISLRLEKGKTYTLSCVSVTKGGANNPVLRTLTSDSSKNIYYEITNNKITFTPSDDVLSATLYSNGYSASNSIDVTSNIKGLMIEEGTSNTSYESCSQTQYTASTNESLTIKQKVNYTQIYSETLGVAVSGKFMLSQSLVDESLESIIKNLESRISSLEASVSN